MKQPTVRIGEAARRAGVNIRTLHYYEARGLLPEPERTESNFRIYTEETIRRIRFVKRAQQLGFSLKEIKDLLAHRVDSKATCADVRERAQSKIADIEKRIVSLQAMKEALARVTAACSGRGSVSECPILECFDKQTKPR
jgi:Hg(II)-responsive transcriptional regulator